jgi:hypothetical protein
MPARLRLAPIGPEHVDDLWRLGVDEEVTRQIALALPDGRWARDRLELGQAGRAFAFENLGAEEVVAFTERHNRRSRAVMERLGMRHPARGEALGEPL